MSNPYKISESKANVVLSSILSGDVPSIRVEYSTTGAGGMKRSIFRQFPLPDARLFARVQTELHEGDEIEITAVNEWYEDGYITRVIDFNKISGAISKHNGAKRTIALPTNSITEIVIPPVQDAKTKVRH